MKRHAVITGAGTGIGAACATSLHCHGFRVTLLGRRCEPINQIRNELGNNAIAYPCDVTKAENVEEAFTYARKQHGPISVIVNSAGIAPTEPFKKLDEASWRKTLDVNLTGCFLVTKEGLPDMIAQNWGRIIQIASVASTRGFEYASAYCAAKHGVLGLTRSLAKEVAQKGVTVNAVCPSYVDTDIVNSAIENIVTKTNKTRDEAMTHFVDSNPQKRLLTTQEVASVVSWLTEDGAAGINGQAINIDGGDT